MATLNLIPNPPVLAVQAVIFFINYLIVKKLFVAPFLKVKDRRDKLTSGNKGEATRMLAEAETLSLKINERLQATFDAAKVDREKIREAAVSKRNVLLESAEKDSRTQIEAVEVQIQRDLAQERAKIPGVVAQLTDDVYRIALA